MAFPTFVSCVFLISLSFIGYAQCKGPPLTKFGKKAKEHIPDEKFDKVFATNYKDSDELAKAVEEGSKNFFKVLGVPRNDSIVKEIDEENDSIGDNKITPELLFHAYTFAIDKSFKKFGILKEDNIDHLAHKFAEEIDKAAKDLDEDDIFATFKAMTTAIAKFLKSEGVNTEERINEFDKLFFEELNKYKKKSLVDDVL